MRKLDTMAAALGYRPATVFRSLPPVARDAEFQRIANLPRRPVPLEGSLHAQALVELARERFGREATFCACRSRGRECITSLRTVQAWGLYELGIREGLLGAIGVGHGKTVLDILAPLAIPNCKIAVLLCPPGLIHQLIAEYELLREHWRVPSLISHGNATYNAMLKGVPVLHVFPYSRLSRADATVWFDTVKPDFVIADEVHYLRNPDTATTSRVMRHFRKYPNTRFAGWSGSVTDSRLEDFAHLSGLALREHSPVPLKRETLSLWSLALSAGDDPSPPGCLIEFCEPGENVREGYHKRLSESQGFVTTSEASVDIPFRLLERKAPPLPPTIANMLEDLRATWTRPDGEELTDPLSLARCARELACGLYYRWKFPRREPVALIQEWLRIRKLWNAELREYLQARKEFRDSPLLCKLAAMRAHGDLQQAKNLPTWKAEHWPAWRDIEDKVKPETEAVRVDDYLVRDAINWATDNRGIVWYDINDFGEWVSELSGLPKHGGGPDAGPRIMSERGDRSIVVSLKAHGTGRDGLQRLYNTQLIAQPPSKATTWEQCLGRLYRIGQKSDLVTANFYRHTPELAKHVDNAIANALYVSKILGTKQKILSEFV